MVRRTLSSLPGQRRAPEHEIKQTLAELGLLVPKGIYLAKGGRLPSPLRLSYPLVAKVVSAKIFGKSDVGGVRREIVDRWGLKKAVAELLAIPASEGVLIEEQARPGLEVIVGGIRDPQFGPVVMFGMGGIAAEVWRDVAFALAPLSREDAEWLLTEIKSRKLLEGFRGNPPVDREALIKVLLVVSDLMSTGKISEMDLNPVRVYPEGAIVLDAKIVRAAPPGRSGRARQLRGSPA